MPEVLLKLKDYDFNANRTQFYTKIETRRHEGTEPDGIPIVYVDVRDVPFIRQSERSSFKGCQYAWNWAWNMGLTPALPKQDARWFGTGLHLCLAEHYIKGKKRGRNMHETWDEFCGENYATIATGPYFKPDEWVDAKALGHEMIDNYYAEYGDDPDWEVIATEQRYRYKVKDADGIVIAILVGTFDAVLRHVPTGKVWMIDHKTARDRINTNHLVKDEQAGTYVSIGTIVMRQMGLIGKDEIVHGIMYNFLRKAKADKRPRNEKGSYLNKDGSVSKQQPAPLFHREFIIRNRYEQDRQIQRVRDEVIQMRMLREGEMALTKAPADHCGWCDFKDICDVDEQGGDVTAYAQAAFRVRDPYADHRQGAANSKTSVQADKGRKAEVKKARAF
jgi:hypothetical protein